MFTEDQKDLLRITITGLIMLYEELGEKSIHNLLEMLNAPQGFNKFIKNKAQLGVQADADKAGAA